MQVVSKTFLTSLTKTFLDVVLGILIGVLLSGGYLYKVYQHETTRYKQEIEQHHLCKDTRTHTAWLARKDGEIRCFLEQDDYPHRAKGTHIDDYTEDLSTSGG